MLVNSKEMLQQAKKGKYAVPHFNINNLEWAKNILEKCNEMRLPVILGVSEGAMKYMGGCNTIVGMVKGLITDLNITIPVCLHVDHGQSFETCKKAIDAGFTSVMIDASKYPLSENVRITKEVVDYAHAKGVTVEIDRTTRQLVVTVNDAIRPIHKGEDLEETETQHVYYYNLDGWVNKYSRPYEFLLALHMATMAPEFAYEVATSPETNAKVIMDFKPVTVEMDLIVDESMVGMPGVGFPTTPTVSSGI